MTILNYSLVNATGRRSNFFCLLAAILTSLISFVFPNDLASQCTAPPAIGTCSGGNGVATNGIEIKSGQTYWYAGTGTFSNGVHLQSGGTLRVCGSLIFTTMQFEGGNILIESGGTLTINGAGALNMNGNSVISNRGTLNINRSIVMQNSNNSIFNATESAIMNMSAGSYSMDINSSTSRFINNGIANVFAMNIQSSAPGGALCLGLGSCVNLTNLTNNFTNSVSAPSGEAAIRYTGNALLNNNLTNSTNVVVCQATGATKTGAGTFGSAVVVQNCPSCSLALPIELISFEGKQENERISLNWATETELQNDYFTVEKSAAGTLWNGIGDITGAGNSIQPMYYAFLDRNPQPGMQYYRLRQTNFDGTSTVSGVISIRFDASASPILIYPNPNQTNQLNLMGIDYDTQFTLGLKNMTGELLYSLPYSGNTVMLPALPKGIYFLSIKLEGDPMTKTFKYVIQ